MADTVAITAGSGTTIGTDEVTIGGTLQHVQRVKLVDGADGGTGLIGGDATNGLDVDVTRLPALAAGTNNIGDVDVLTFPAPHATQSLTSVSANYTTTQTSTNLVAGTGGQKIYVTALSIGTGGTTAGLISLYWGTGAFTRGTSPTLFEAEFAPSSTVRPGATMSFPLPVGGQSATGDNLRITTSAGITCYVTVHYYKA